MLVTSLLTEVLSIQIFSSLPNLDLILIQGSWAKNEQYSVKAILANFYLDKFLIKSIENSHVRLNIYLAAT